MGSHWVTFFCTLIVVFSWPEDCRSRPKHVAKYHLIVIIASCLMYVVYWRCIIYYTNLIIHNGMASPKLKRVVYGNKDSFGLCNCTVSWEGCHTPLHRVFTQTTLIGCKQKSAVHRTDDANWGGTPTPSRTVLFWAITQWEVVIPYRRFGTISRSLLQRLRIQDWQ